MKSDSDVAALRKSLDAARKDAADFKKKFAPFKDMNAEEVRAKLDSFEELELRANSGSDKAIEEKIAERIEARVKSVKQPLERQIQTAQEELKTLMQERDGLRSEKVRNTIEGSLRKLASEGGIRAEAVDDLLLHVGQLEIDENEQVVSKSHKLPVKEYFETLRSTRPHWTPANEGGGANGNKPRPPGGAGGEPNPWKQETFNFNEQGRIAKQNPEKAAVFRKQAGVKEA